MHQIYVVKGKILFQNHRHQMQIIIIIRITHNNKYVELHQVIVHHQLVGQILLLQLSQKIKLMVFLIKYDPENEYVWANATRQVVLAIYQLMLIALN
eukprot:UN03142